MPPEASGPLRSLRVIDSSDGQGEMCGRYLADLGAEVVRVEPPAGSGTRRTGPFHDGVSLRDATQNANKRGVALDPGADRDTFLRLLATADIWISTARHEQLAALDLADLRRRLPQLVIVSITDFGLTGPYRDYVATERVHAAMSGHLCRSGIPGRRPLLPPDGILEQAVAAQATWCALTAHYQRLRTGFGDHLDVSAHETALQVLDPPFGAGPTAGYGRPWWDFPHDRPDVAHYYPVVPCSDGYVRICLLSAGQWRALRRWLGEPEQFQDPKYDAALERQNDHSRLQPLIAELFAPRTAMELTDEGQQRGIPIAPVLNPGQAPRLEHFRERGSFTELEVAPGVRASAPSGYVEVDGERAGLRHRAPRLGEHDDQVLACLPPTPPPADRPEPPEPVERDQPLRGLRILDLGVIVVGAEAGRLFADLGAEVIKVENSKHPDGSRAPFTGAVSTGFAWGHRNKESFAVDLGSAEGVRAFERLAAGADLVLSNFKPGTLEKLGIGRDRLAEINPALSVVESSALGHTGPWRRWMGYGPLVRAVTGLTELWQDTGDGGGFADGITVYPDHVVGRIVDTAALAVLIERRATGRGRSITCSQAETIFTALSTEIVEDALAPGSIRPHGNAARLDAPSGVYRCAGEDQWCVVAVRGDADYGKLRELLDLPDLPHASDRLAHQEAIDAAVEAWTGQRTGDAVLGELQAAGVPAGPMRRIADLPDDPALGARRIFGTLHQPTVPDPLPTEARQHLSATIADAALAPAPLQGQHTREIATRVLGMPPEEIDKLVAEGVLEEPDPWQPLREIRTDEAGS